MNQQNVDKKTEEILEELGKILDKLTSKDTKQQDEFFKKVDNLKHEIEAIKESSLTEKISQQLQLGTKQKEEVKSIIEEKISLPVEKTETEKIEVTETTKAEEKKERKQINIMLIFPSAIPNSKDEFFNNINSTLSRIGKNKVEILLSSCIKYESFDKDLVLNYSVIIEKIKQHNIFALFLIVNDRTMETTNFIKKISSDVTIAKDISFKELKLKSTYLDIAIDLLLSIS